MVYALHRSVRSGTLPAAFLAASFSFLAACGGGGGGNDPPAPPDLSGVWSGVWQGSDPTIGPVTVSGTWIVTITQGASSASGPGTLFGDIDCMDGQMQTNPAAQTAVTGSVTRPPPCGTVDWTLTALELGSGSAAGTWRNNVTNGTGTMSGTRIAALAGPRILFVSPPGAKPGAWATIVGQDLANPTSLRFNTVPQALFSAQATRIVARVPPAATTGAIEVTTPAGSARSPVAFDTGVGAPPLALGGSINLGLAPAALAVSPDGRKFYVADRLSPTIRVVRASTLSNNFTQTFLGSSPRSVVASPDGRRVYVAAAGIGVLVLDAASGVELGRAVLAIDDGGRDNPQGIAISPDGTRLAVSSGTAGGSVTVYGASGNSLTFQLAYPMPLAQVAPLGVAFAPDGSRVYVAAADTSGGAANTLRSFDPATGAEIDADTVELLPTAIAVHPAGDLVFVTNKNSSSVSMYNAVTGTVTRTETVGTSPTGIAYTPDGSRVYVVNQGSNTLSVLDGASGVTLAGSPFAVGTGSPLAIAVNPAGTTAYVTRLTGGSGASVVEVGGMRTLTVAKAGTGIGTVASTPAGINCGTTCQAQFPVGSGVSLAATAQTGSSFAGWSGAGCGAFVTVTQNMTCTATFNSNAPPPSQQQQQQGGCFIATAAYGSDAADDVRLLREFRDRWLLPNAAGRAFVSFYYRHSPSLAGRIRENEAARAAVRAGLVPIVWAIAHPAHALWLAFSCALLGWSWRRRVRIAAH